MQTPQCKHIWSYIHIDMLLSCPILLIYVVMQFQNGSWLLEGSKWHSTSTQINRKINCPISNNTYNVGTKTYLAAQVLQTGNIYMYNILHLTCNVSRRTLHIFQHLPRLTHIWSFSKENSQTPHAFSSFGKVEGTRKKSLRK